MVPVIAPRFDLDECNNELERQFAESIHTRAEIGGWYADTWPCDDRFMLSIDVSDKDPLYNCVLRTLRVDFDGATVMFGTDETGQFATDLDPARCGVSVLSGLTIPELATAVADWLEREMRRPIVRHEWDTLDSRGVAPRLWVLADTNESLVYRGQRPSCAPDRVVPIGC